ncbi:MAG TPA: hypothetical protein VFR70_00275 [Flavobacterium sp.]|nr:hypothetical protein [Flavobacterium sp.]
MRRIHLFEIEDQKWFPRFLRDYMTDFLQFLSNAAKIYKPVLNVLTEKLLASRTHHIIDLASGGGGGLLWLNAELREKVPDLKITLTDYFPNVRAFQNTKNQAGNIDFIAESVDARNVPARLSGFRTQFLSFHHFRPDDAKRILQNAINSKNPIAVVEAQDRSLPSVLAMVFSPLSVILTTPFIRPFRIGRLFFTYVLPIIPLCVLWDGLISCFRTYTVREMKELVEQLENKEEFEWSIGKEKNVLYLIGLPR